MFRIQKSCLQIGSNFSQPSFFLCRGKKFVGKMDSKVHPGYKNLASVLKLQMLSKGKKKTMSNNLRIHRIPENQYNWI